MSGPVILLVDDDDDDRLLIQRALEESGTESELFAVADGVELFDYLHRRNAFQYPALAPRPSIVLLDLNMPRMDGHQVLRSLKETDCLRGVPIVVLTTSSAQDDVRECYELGCASYIRKPSSFDEMVDIMKTVSHYWLTVVEIPET
jgi:two-component system response regulator